MLSFLLRFILLHLFAYMGLTDTFPIQMQLLDTISLTEPCKQFQLGPSRIYCLSSSNIIMSWLKNGTSYAEFTDLKNSKQQTISEFRLDQPRTEILFSQKGTKNMYKLSAQTLELISFKAENQTYSTYPRSGKPEIEDSNLKLPTFNTQNKRMTFGRNYIVSFSDRMVFDFFKSQIQIKHIFCPPGSALVEDLTLSCTNFTSKNISTLTRILSSESQSFQISQISTSASKNLQLLSSITLSNQAVIAINQIPASRLLFRSIFMFFSNFDDLELYNFINATFNPVIQEIFDQIEHLQREKWKFVSFPIIWQDCFGINFNRIKQYFNSPERKSFTSPKFLSLQKSANGYIVNTLQFYLINSFLVCFMFLTGNFAFKFLKKYHRFIKSLFLRFRLWLAFPIFLFEGNIQYMSYLMGFQIKNLWVLNPTDKCLAFCLIFLIFVFFFTLSTIYFLMRYLNENYLKNSDENCRQSSKGVLYISLFSSVRNITLGFLHEILPQDEKNMDSKFKTFIFLECLFLITQISLIRKQFYKSKTRQWIMILSGFTRILLIKILMKDSQVQNALKNQFNNIFSNSYAVLMLSYLTFWVLLMLYEIVTLGLISFKYFGSQFKKTTKIQIRKPILKSKTLIVGKKSANTLKSQKDQKQSIKQETTNEESKRKLNHGVKSEIIMDHRSEAATIGPMKIEEVICPTETSIDEQIEMGRIEKEEKKKVRFEPRNYTIDISPNTTNEVCAPQFSFEVIKPRNLTLVSNKKTIHSLKRRQQLF